MTKVEERLKLAHQRAQEQDRQLAEFTARIAGGEKASQASITALREAASASRQDSAAAEDIQLPGTGQAGTTNGFATQRKLELAARKAAMEDRNKPHQEESEPLRFSISDNALQDTLQQFAARAALKQDNSAEQQAREQEKQQAEAKVVSLEQAMNELYQQMEGYKNNGQAGEVLRAEKKYAQMSEELAEAKSAIEGSSMEEAADWGNQKYLEIIANGGKVLAKQLENLADLAAARYDESEEDRRRGGGASDQYNELYNRLKDQYGEQVDSWLDYTQRMNNQADMAERLEKTAAAAEEHPFWTSLGSIPLNLASGTGFLNAATQKLQRGITGSDTPIDYNDPAQSASKMTNTIRGTVSQDMGKVGSFLYNTAMSMGDSAATMAIGGLSGMGSLGTVLLGGSAATNAMNEAIERGASDNQALTIGLFAGAAETLMEKASIDSLFNLKTPENAKDVILNIFKQAGAEGTEEGLTTLVNTLADAFVMGNKSDLETTKRAYMEQGYDEDTAEGMALRDWATGLALDVAGGALSGGVFAGVHSPIMFQYESQNGNTQGERIATSPAETRNVSVGTAATGVDVEQAVTDTYNQSPVSGNTQQQAKVAQAVADMMGQNNAPTQQVGDDTIMRNISQKYAQWLDETGNTSSMNAYHEFVQTLSAEEQEVLDRIGEAASKARDAAEQANASSDGVRLLLPEQSEITKQRGYPYEKENAVYKVVEIPDEKVAEIEAYINTVNSAQARKKYKRILKNLFSGQKFTNANTVANEIAYEIGIGSKGIGEIISRQPVNAQTLAMLEQLDEIVENAKYVASEPTSHPERSAINRTDIFEADTRIGDQPGKARLRVNSANQGNTLYFATNKMADTQSSQPRYVSESRGVERTGSATNSTIRSDSQNVKREITVDDVMPKVKDTGAKEAMGAADYGFSPYSNYQNTQSQFHSEGANAARPVDMPVTDPQGQKTSRFASNVAGAQAVPDSGVEQIESDFMAGKYGYEVKGDQQAVDKANQLLQKQGYDYTRAQTIERLQSLKDLKQTMVNAQLLINQAYQEGRDADAAEMIILMTEASPEIAQGLQSLSIMRKLTPEGQLEGLKRTITKLEEKVNSKLSKKAREKFGGIQVDEALAQKFLAATDEDSRAAVMDEIYQDIGSKIPTTFKDIANQWRYTSMLLNPSTHARNIVGNAGQLGMSTMKDALATLGEAGVDWASKKLRHGKGIQRTKAFLNLSSESDRALLDLAGNDYDTTARDLIMDGGKYKDSPESQIEQRREIWKLNDPQSKVAKAVDATLRAAGKVSDTNSNLMDVEDTWFSKPMYRVALAGYMKANGLTEITDEARAYAVKEAQKSTYRDSNIISDWAKRMGRDNKGLGKVVSFVINTIFPFKGTPANVGVRAWEYSPAGLITTVGKAAVSAYNGTFNAASFIDDLSANLVGSGLAAAGIWLAQSGVLKVKPDDQEENEGYESNSINLFGYSVPINNLGSAAIPLLVGGAIYENFIEQNPDSEGHTIDEFLKSLSATLDPVLQSSMLTGLQDLIDSFDSGDYGDATLGEMVTVGMINVVGNYISSYIPTLLSKVANATDTAARKTYIDRNQDGTDFQYALQSLQKKIPGLRQQMTEMVDQYGDTVEGGLPSDGSTLSKVAQAVAGAISPTYWSKIKTTEVDEELRRLVTSEGVDTDGMPLYLSDAPKSFSVDGKTVYLTGDQWEQYAKTRNSTTHQIRSDILNSERYEALPDDMKASAMDMAYQYANNLGKVSADVGYQTKDKWMQELAGATPEDVADAIITRTVKLAADNAETDKYTALGDMLDNGTIEDQVAISLLPDSTFEKWETYGEKCKVPVSTLMDALGYYNSDESNSLKNKKGEDIKGETQKDHMEKWIQEQDLTRKQKRGLWCMFYAESSSPW